MLEKSFVGNAVLVDVSMPYSHGEPGTFQYSEWNNCVPVILVEPVRATGELNGPESALCVPFDVSMMEIDPVMPFDAMTLRRPVTFADVKKSTNGCGGT